MLTESVKKVYVCRLTCCQACRSVCPVSQKLPSEIFHYGEYGEITLVNWSSYFQQLPSRFRQVGFFSADGNSYMFENCFSCMALIISEHNCKLFSFFSLSLVVNRPAHVGDVSSTSVLSTLLDVLLISIGRLSFILFLYTPLMPLGVENLSFFFDFGFLFLVF